MTILKNVAIIGASGNIGTPILRALLADKELNVTIISRESSKTSFPEGTRVVRSDFIEASLVEAFKGQDAVISVVGAQAIPDQKKYADAAIKAGVKRFLPSEFGINSLNAKGQELVPFLGMKVDIINYLKEKEASGLSWTLLFPGLLFDWGLRAGFLGFDIKDKKATIWDEGRSSFSLTNEEDLGRAVVSILRHPSETENKAVYVQTVSTTQKELLDTFEAQTGSNWTIQSVKTADKIATAQQQLAEGNFEGMFTLVQVAGYGDVPAAEADFEKSGKLANNLLDLPFGNVRDTVRSVLGA